MIGANLGVWGSAAASYDLLLRDGIDSESESKAFAVASASMSLRMASFAAAKDPAAASLNPESFEALKSASNPGSIERSESSDS